ncbi:hypothetical protein TWF281_000733 [Arthrobotrys megalospora]
MMASSTTAPTDYHPDSSIGSQHIIVRKPDNPYNRSNSFYCYSPITLTSSSINSLRVSADFFSDPTIANLTFTGTLRILSVPNTFSVSWYQVSNGGFGEIFPLFDTTNILSDTEQNLVAKKTMAVMKGNVASDVTCLYMLPLTWKGPSDKLLNCEGSKEVAYELPRDHQLIALLTTHAYGRSFGYVEAHVFVNVR